MHRLFSFIPQNWRGRPPTSLATTGSMVGATRTQTGLWVGAELDRGTYPKGRKVTEAEMAEVQRVPDRFHGDWNYTPRPKTARTT